MRDVIVCFFVIKFFSDFDFYFLTIIKKLLAIPAYIILEYDMYC